MSARPTRRGGRVATLLGATALAAILAGGSAGCQSACDALAETICACEPNRTSESACLQAVAAADTRDVTEAEAADCEQRLDTCTCEALEDGDQVACGLAKPPPTTGGT